METEGKPKKKLGHWTIIGLLFGGVVAAEIINVLVIEKVYDKLDRASFFGGYHGAISAVFTGLAAAFTLYLIFLQKEEIQQNEQNRREDEAKRTVEQFEARFFKIIEMWRGTIVNLEVQGLARKATGIDYFKLRVRIFNYKLACHNIGHEDASDEAILPKMYSWCHLANTASSKKSVIHVNMKDKEARKILNLTAEDEYMDCADSYVKLFLHLLLQILKHVEDEEERSIYVNVLTSVMTNDELYFLHYSSFSGRWPVLENFLDALRISQDANSGLERDYRIKLIESSPSSIPK